MDFKGILLKDLKEIISLIACIYWQIWKAQNNSIFGNECFCLFNVIDSTRRPVREYLRFEIVKPGEASLHVFHSWNNLCNDWVKVKFDGVNEFLGNKAGFGAIGRNEVGNLLFAMACLGRLLSSHC